jgi:hypothetical protein
LKFYIEDSIYLLQSQDNQLKTRIVKLKRDIYKNRNNLAKRERQREKADGNSFAEHTCQNGSMCVIE